MKKLNRSYTRPGLGLAVVLAATCLTSQISEAVPYASQISSNNNTVTFILNQNAQGLVVLRDGANPVYPGTTAGQLSFDMTGFTNYSIIVTGDTPKAWTQYIPDGADRNFWFPNSVAINKNPKSPNFGKVYVSNNNRVAPGNTGAFGRLTTDGIYVLRADGVAINSTPYNGGMWLTNDSANYSNPYKINIGPDDDRVYFTSFYDDLAYVFSDDMSTVTQLIDASNKTTSQYVESIYALGSQAAGNLVIYTVDGNYNSTRKGLIAYTLGANATATASDTGSQVVGPDCYNAAPNAYYPNDVDRDSSGNWYMTTYRASANQAPDIGKFDGSLPWPINTFVWNASGQHAYVRGIGVNEAGGTVATGRWLNPSGQVYFYDIGTGVEREMFDIGNVCRDVAFDVAGNMVSVDNSLEFARFWSPGGKTVATTRSDGTFDLSSLDNVSVIASDTAASEEGLDPATFSISRYGGDNADVLVYFTLTGTATSNVDYTVSVTSPFTFKAGDTTTNITIIPKDDGLREQPETVIVTLVSNATYYLTSQKSATNTISDNDLLVRYWDANGADPGAGSIGGTWGTDNFWTTSPDGTAATTAWQDWAQAVFSAGTEFGTFTVTVNGTQRVDGPVIEDSTVTFTGGTLLLTNFGPITVAGSAQATINSAISGVSGLSKDGQGPLSLGGANTYSGPTTLLDGVTTVTAANAIPDTSTVSIGATATLDLNGNTETIGGLAGVTGGYLSAAGVTLTFGANNEDTLFNGTSSVNSLELVKVGAGRTRMEAGELGDTLRISGGTLAINAAARLGAGNVITIENGATLESFSPGVGTDFLNTARTVTLGTGGGALKVTDSGAILMVHDGTVISGDATLTKDGPGELRTYSVQHTFAKLLVKQGLYTAGHSVSLGYADSFGAIPTTLTPDAITLQDGAAIRKAGGQNVTLDPKQGITLVNGGLIRSYAGDVGTGTFEIPGPISGTGPLRLGSPNDVGTVIVLSGNNTYTGGTIVAAGTNDVRVDGGLGTGDVTVNSGAVLKLNSGAANSYINSQATLSLSGAESFVDLAFTGTPNTIKSLIIGGVTQAAGTWGAPGSGAAHESPLFTGTGMLNVTSGGVVPQPVSTMTIGTITGGNITISYSGGTGTQFVLLRSVDVEAAIATWARLATNVAASGSFTIPVGADPKAFYRIQSE